MSGQANFVEWKEEPLFKLPEKLEEPKYGLRGEFKQGVLVGIPTYGHVDIDFALNLLRTVAPVNCHPYYFVVRGKPLDEALNMIVRKALEMDADYVYFQEDDVLTPVDALERLMALDVDIVSATCFSKQKPPYPIILKSFGGGPYTEWYDEPGKPIQVVGTGLGATLVKTKVFKKIPPPWFKVVHRMKINGKIVGGMTADLYFCWKALRYGFNIWVDTGCLCAHKDFYTGTIYFFDPTVKLPAWRDPGDAQNKYVVPVYRNKLAEPLPDDAKEQAVQEFVPSLLKDLLSDWAQVTENKDEIILRIQKRGSTTAEEQTPDSRAT